MRLPAGVAAGQEYSVYVHAVNTPGQWLAEWDSTLVEYPRFAVLGAARDLGALAIQAAEDTTVYPQTLEGLTPLDEGERAASGLPAGTGSRATLAYRYEGQLYRAAFRVARITPRTTARAYTFIRLEPGVLRAHHELVYVVQEARARKLSLWLPLGTPGDVAIRALDGVTLKEYESAVVDGRRKWTVHLAEARRDAIRLAVDYEQRLDKADEPDDAEPARGASGLKVSLPIARAANVAYQSGIVAVESDAELEVQISEHPRRVDAGELAAAEPPTWHRPSAGGPSAGGLGVFEYTGDQTEVLASIARPPRYALPPALVQRAQLVTLLSAEGTSQTAVRLRLRTKAVLLEVDLPDGSQLWSIELDGQPAKPQREGQRLLLSLPAASGDALRDLRIVYDTPVASLGFWGEIDVPALRLVLRMDGPESPPVTVPAADVDWNLCLPSGFQMVRHAGTLATEQATLPEPAALTAARALYRLCGGINPFYGGSACPLFPTLRAARDLPPAALSGPVFEAEIAQEERARLESLGYVSDDEDQSALRAPQSEPQARLRADEKTVLPTQDKGALRAGDEIRRHWALTGVRSLKIELDRTGETVAFQSLGVAPQLNVTLANQRRVDALAYGLALVAGLIGLALALRRPRARIVYTLVVALVATLLPFVAGRPELASVLNPTFWMVLLLALLYLTQAIVSWCIRRTQARAAARIPSTSATMVMLASLLLTNAALGDQPDTQNVDREAVLRHLLEPRPPVIVPEDAIIVPYDPQVATSRPSTCLTERILVPYNKFVELWNAAYPHDRTELRPPPAAYALAGASYTATLTGDDCLHVDGRIEIDVYGDEPVGIPLALAGGVLTGARLDGSPASLGISPTAPTLLHGPQASVSGQAEPRSTGNRPDSTLCLQISGKGRHQLDLTLRMLINRSGGWRGVAGRLPFAPATALTLHVPQAGTDVRLTGVADRRTYETKTPGESIETALREDETLAIQWRSLVQAGKVDPSLTVKSLTLLDVREDGLRLIWDAKLDFGRSERDTFSIVAPAGYLVRQVTGTNVRGWTLRETAAGEADPASARELRVTLLKSVAGEESVAVVLHRSPGSAEDDLAAFDVPVIDVVGAVLHSGQLIVRRSPLLDLHTERAVGLTRIDVPPQAEQLANLVAREHESPLGVRPYQAYQFATAPFAMRLSAKSTIGKPTADVQTVLRVAERRRDLESRVSISPAGYPVYRVRIVLPGDLWLEHVSAPGAFEWAETTADEQRIVSVYLTTGQQSRFSILLRGTLGEREELSAVPLPRIEVADVRHQRGDIVVQVDPAFDLQLTLPANCHETSLRAVHWLNAEQRPLARLALHYETPSYGGVLQLTPREPIVRCSTITNVRVAETTLEETILLSFDIRKAGIRAVSFVLPERLKAARISAPMLRLKEIEPLADRSDGAVRVRLALQDEVMGHLRVLVENDRLLTAETQLAPIPIIETGQTTQCYVTLESAGRDEVIVEEPVGLEALTHRQKEWRELANLLGTEISQAYLVSASPDAQPRLAFRTKERIVVATAGARIGLAQAVLAVDAFGAYRAAQSYRIDNATEQFLEVELPIGASLWSVLVAGEPVKPARVGGGGARRVRVPLIRTTAGDLDYEVVLSYGGQFPAPGRLRTVSFPLVSTINVPVELSQVRLFLPETQRWFDFGGTMRLVTEEGDLAAEYLRYQTAVAERLAQTLEVDNLFAKTRAALSFRNLKSEIEQFQKSTSRFDSNVNLQQENISNLRVIRRGEQQLQQFDQRPAQQRELEFNRDRLNDLFDAQVTNRARNLVQNLPGNFEEAPQPEAGQQMQSQERFDREWIASAQLGQAAADSQAALSRDQVDREARLKIPTVKRSKGMQPQAPEVAQRKLEDQIMPQQAVGRGRRGMMGGGRAGARASTDELAERYQQQLQQSAQAREPSLQAGINVLPAPGGEPDASRGSQSGLGRGSGLSPSDSVGAATGLVSLPVEFPTRGVVYNFTTPRGQVAITARAVSQHSLMMGWRLGAVLLMIVIGCAIYQLARRRAAIGSTGTTAMIAVGIASALSGVLPVAGLVLVVIGGVAKSRRRGRVGI
ncbi:MAG: hypothetical protein KKB50_13795 [Planctomycetes bacterium]|nr:hypothetical protein [Planctomycetota bacterium]